MTLHAENDRRRVAVIGANRPGASFAFFLAEVGYEVLFLDELPATVPGSCGSEASGAALALARHHDLLLDPEAEAHIHPLSFHARAAELARVAWVYDFTEHPVAVRRERYPELLAALSGEAFVLLSRAMHSAAELTDSLPETWRPRIFMSRALGLARPTPLIEIAHAGDEVAVTVENRFPRFLPDRQDSKGDFEGKTNRYGTTGIDIRRVMVRASWNNMAIAELRDLNRHRTGHSVGPGERLS